MNRRSTPLPPISRFDDVKVNRRCAKLRAALNKAYTEALPAFRDATISLKVLLNQDDMEKYLDVYDIPHHAVQEAVSPALISLEDDDPESLRSLRVVSYQYSTLRRVVCCSLMSLEADGGNTDFARWSAATKIMNSLSTTTATWAQKLSDLLREVEEFTIPREVRLSTRPAGERLRTQVRKITDLSQGIRSLQAKMALMREESTKAIEDSDDLTDLGPNLMSQYESIGADLKMLTQAWENGKASLANNLDKQERRISQASSGLRSPAASLGGLTAVEEGGPADALRALNGESKSSRSSLAGSGSDEEVFEGVSLHIPRLRSSLTRDERIAKMQEERVRLSEIRDKRDSGTNMIRELQSVMNLKSSATPWEEHASPRYEHLQLSTRHSHSFANLRTIFMNIRQSHLQQSISLRPRLSYGHSTDWHFCTHTFFSSLLIHSARIPKRYPSSCYYILPVDTIFTQASSAPFNLFIWEAFLF
jgi:hypothetical protein